MGNQILTRLWNQYPNNMEACSAPERDFLPTMDDYFTEAAEQLDPSSGIEEEYKKVNDGQWGWRALRLLAKKSPHFFTHGNNPIAKLPDYLESILKKQYNITAVAARPENGSNDTKKEVVADVCSKEQLEKLATNLADNWPKLMAKLGLDKEEKKNIEEKATEDKGKF